MKSPLKPTRKSRRAAKKRAPSSLEIFILAGGLSSRMGRDKAALKLGSRTLLGHIRAVARSTGFAVRSVRRDVVPRCGPLGGVYTGLKKTSAESCLFLACDMPLITPDFLQKIVARFQKKKRALFTITDSAGFPFVLPRDALPLVERQIAAKQFSLHALAATVKAHRFEPNSRERSHLLNINTPAEWQKLQSAPVQGVKTRSRNGCCAIKDI